jgi:DNA replication protein DnaC
MEALPNRNDVMQQRDARCDFHGPYVSRNMFRGRVWSACPACEEERRAREAEAEEQARIEREQAALRRRIENAGIPARFVGRTFDTFRAETEEQRAALTICRDFAENFVDNVRRGQSLILSGKPGTGKSHLSAAILQALLQHDVRYTTAMGLVRAVRDTWRRDSERSERDLLRSLGSLDLLVIDEIGMQYGTDGEQTILFDVLDGRYRDMTSTVLITNQDREGFRGYVGDRVFDRLRETARWVSFDWESYRPTARKEWA